MSNLPFTLPTCDRSATVRLEVYSAAGGTLQGSLDASVYVCDLHGIEAVSAIQAAGLTAQRVPLAPDIVRPCGDVYVFPTGAIAAATIEHPRWCDRKTCERLRVHASPVKPVDTNRPEATVLDVALIQEWHPAAEPQISLTVIDGATVDQVLMSLGQARVLSYRIRQLLDATKGGRR